MAGPKKGKAAAPLRVEQFGMMLDTYLKKAGLRKTKGEKKIAGSVKRLRALTGAAEKRNEAFAAELRRIGDEEGAAAVEEGMGKEEWQKFWTRERIGALRRSMKIRRLA